VHLRLTLTESQLQEEQPEEVEERERRGGSCRTEVGGGELACPAAEQAARKSRARVRHKQQTPSPDRA
jgi:hypothetical protein